MSDEKSFVTITQFRKCMDEISLLGYNKDIRSINFAWYEFTFHENYTKVEITPDCNFQPVKFDKAVHFYNPYTKIFTNRDHFILVLPNFTREFVSLYQLTTYIRHWPNLYIGGADHQQIFSIRIQLQDIRNERAIRYDHKCFTGSKSWRPEHKHW